MSARPPLVGLPADLRVIDGQPFHALGDKYARAVALAAGALPVMIPALADVQEPAAVLEHLDGLLLTGARSNVHPSRYGAEPSAAAEPYDETRDASTFALIEAALERGLPLLAICRGLQELNACLGGTLHPRVHELPGRLDHRRPEHPDRDVQYGPRHRVRLCPGGALAELLGRREIEVNSLHWQAVDRVAPALVVEGEAEDGTIEALRVREARGFALAVQWHPEYKVLDDPHSTALFRAFGAAAAAWAAARGGPRHRSATVPQIPGASPTSGPRPAANPADRA